MSMHVPHYFMCHTSGHSVMCADVWIWEWLRKRRRERERWKNPVWLNISQLSFPNPCIPQSIWHRPQWFSKPVQTIDTHTHSSCYMVLSRSQIPLTLWLCPRGLKGRTYVNGGRSTIQNKFPSVCRLLCLAFDLHFFSIHLKIKKEQKLRYEEDTIRCTFPCLYYEKQEAILFSRSDICFVSARLFLQKRQMLKTHFSKLLNLKQLYGAVS